MRIILLTDQIIDKRGNCLLPFIESVRDKVPDRLDIKTNPSYVLAVEQASLVQHQYDCVVTFLRAGQIFQHEGLFNELTIPVVVVEHDACQNAIAQSKYYRSWSEYFSRNQVAAICVSGRNVQAELQSFISGVIGYVPKAAPSNFLKVKNRGNGQFCIFGDVQSPVYAQRKAVFDSLADWGIYDRFFRKTGWYALSWLIQSLSSKKPNCRRVSFGHDRMGEVLRYFSGAIISDQGLGEPMMKHYEVSALGLAPFRDDECNDELCEQGYIPNESMITYQTIGDLIDKLEYYSRNPTSLKRIGRAAREVARSNTWDHRADALLKFIRFQIL